MNQRIIEYNDDDLTVKITVARATVLMGMTRTRLRMDAAAADEQDLDRRLLRLFSYPDVMAATLDVEGLDGWPLDFDDFIQLPEELGARWEEAAYELNPHWVPRSDEDEADAAKN